MVSISAGGWEGAITGAELWQKSGQDGPLTQYARAMGPAAPRQQGLGPPADFAGREEELKALSDRVGPGGAVISGFAGGIGKTVLALKLAQELASSTPDGQIDLGLKRP